MVTLKFIYLFPLFHWFTNGPVKRQQFCHFPLLEQVTGSIKTGKGESLDKSLEGKGRWKKINERQAYKAKWLLDSGQ